MLDILVQTKTGTSNLASTVVAFDNNNVAGNSIIVVCGNSSATSGDVSGVTDSQGNTYAKAFTTANASLGDLEVWYASNIKAGANTVTVAYTTGVACAVIIREYYGTWTVGSIFDKQASTTGSSSSLSSGNTTALVQNAELLIGAGLIVATDTFTAGGNFVNLTSVAAPAVVAVATEDLLVLTGGVQSASFTSNLSTQWVCGICTFFLSPTGTTTSTSSTSSTSSSISSTSSSTSSTSTSITTSSISTSSTSSSTSLSITTITTSSTSSSISSTSSSSTSSSTSVSSTSSSISSTSMSSTSQSTTSNSTSISSTSSSFSSTSSSISSTSSSVSSTSFSSTSSSSSTSTTAIPLNLDYSYQDTANAVIVKTFGVRDPSTWVCPPRVTSVLAESWGASGGGGGSQNGPVVGSNGGGGGGGAYSNATISVTPGSSYTISVGAGGTAGTGGASPTAGGDGSDTSFVNSATLLAKAGKGGGLGTGGVPGTGGAGGAAASGVGTVTKSGGIGGDGSAGSQQGGGGGGSGGSNGDGGAGVNTGQAGNAGPLIGGRGGGGGNGGAGATGKTPGGGAGAAGSSAGGAAGAAGTDGLVRLTYTVVGLPSTSSDELNTTTSNNMQNIAIDDSDYFIQYGSEYIIQEFKKKWTNNTDNITFTWKGRTTESTLVSPFLVQIYNQNSAIWETLATVNKIPVDTDFQVTVTQSTNLSNYYDSKNIVTFRTYQQVV